MKTITVNPGHRISLQSHEHRAEFWQVLDGPIDVTVGRKTWSAHRDEKVWAAVGELHRMANSAAAPVRVLEVCWGHFDDDDITRVEDDYGR
ncbi:MAG: cupin domain-containing protein [Jatrophihabitans sp.]